jgi:hypothetical protein
VLHTHDSSVRALDILGKPAQCEQLFPVIPLFINIILRINVYPGKLKKIYLNIFQKKDVL